MTLSRRGFMAAAPAAAIAAPAVATKFVEEVGSLAYAGRALQTADTPYPEGAAHWAESEIKNLIAARARVKEDYATLGEHARFVEAQRIDGLRSVSAVSKARMAAESERRRVLASELKWMDQRIADMKKDYPVLAYLTEALT